MIAAWLAGIDHVLRCEGCPICKVPDDYVPPEKPDEDATVDEAEKPGDETPLDESVKPNYDSPFKKPWGGGPK